MVQLIKYRLVFAKVFEPLKPVDVTVTYAFTDLLKEAVYLS